VPGGALLITLRPLPAGAAVLVLPADIALDARRPGRLFREAVVFDVPEALLF